MRRSAPGHRWPIPLLTSRRGHAFRTQLMQLISLLSALSATSLALLFVLCRSRIPYMVSFNAFLMLPVCFLHHVRPDYVLPLIGKNLMAQVTFVVAPLLINTYCMNSLDRPLWSRCCHFARAALRIDPSYAYTVHLLVGAVFGVCGYGLPYLLLGAVGNWSVVCIGAILCPKEHKS